MTPCDSGCDEIHIVSFLRPRGGLYQKVGILRLDVGVRGEAWLFQGFSLRPHLSVGSGFTPGHKARAFGERWFQLTEYKGAVPF